MRRKKATSSQTFLKTNEIYHINDSNQTTFLIISHKKNNLKC